MKWIKASEPPEPIERRAYPKHVKYLRKDYGGNEHVSKAVAYYFPDRFKTIEWEDWGDYKPEQFPYTEVDEEAGVVWLRAGWYKEEDCESCDSHHWSAPLNVIEWLDESEPAPSPDLEAEAETNRRYASQVEGLKVENERLRVALQKIANWELPPSGKYWDLLETDPMSYEAAYGSNGVRDYIKSIAANALKPKEEQ